MPTVNRTIHRTGALRQRQLKNMLFYQAPKRAGPVIAGMTGPV